MTIMDELKKLTRPYDDDSDYGDDGDLGGDINDTTYTAQAPVQQATPVYTAPAANTAAATPASGSFSNAAAADFTSSAFSNFSVGSSSRGAGEKYRVIVINPEEYKTVKAIAAHILEGNAVILNCENTNPEAARRIVDFLSGTAYAIQGNIMKAAGKVYIFTPKDVGLAEDEPQSEEV